MNAYRSATMAAFLMGLAGCTMPTHSTRALDEKAHLAITNAPETAEILVDGVPAGRARTYDGVANTLAVAGGTHKIEIRSGGQVLYSQPVFLGDGEVKTIVLP